MMNVKKWKRNGLMLLLMGTMMFTAGSALAYFTDTEQAVNNITVGKVDITLTEPKWDQTPDEEKENITPGKVLVKDPKITNTGINDAFVFMTVEVPAAELITANDDGSRNEKRITELYSWNINKGWTQIGTAEDLTNENGKITGRKYLYAYGNESKCTSLEKGIATTELFSSVTFANVIEGQTFSNGIPLEGTVTDIQIHAYGIQTTDLTQNKVTSPEKVWAVLKNQEEPEL